MSRLPAFVNKAGVNINMITGWFQIPKTFLYPTIPFKIRFCEMSFGHPWTQTTSRWPRGVTREPVMLHRWTGKYSGAVYELSGLFPPVSAARPLPRPRRCARCPVSPDRKGPRKRKVSMAVQGHSQGGLWGHVPSRQVGPSSEWAPQAGTYALLANDRRSGNW